MIPVRGRVRLSSSGEHDKRRRRVSCRTASWSTRRLARVPSRREKPAALLSSAPTSLFRRPPSPSRRLPIPTPSPFPLKTAVTFLRPTRMHHFLANRFPPPPPPTSSATTSPPRTTFPSHLPILPLHPIPHTSLLPPTRTYLPTPPPTPPSSPSTQKRPPPSSSISTRD